MVLDSVKSSEVTVGEMCLGKSTKVIIVTIPKIQCNNIKSNLRLTNNIK